MTGYKGRMNGQRKQKNANERQYIFQNNVCRLTLFQNSSFDKTSSCVQTSLFSAREQLRQVFVD